MFLSWSSLKIVKSAVFRLKSQKFHQTFDGLSIDFFLRKCDFHHFFILQVGIYFQFL